MSCPATALFILGDPEGGHIRMSCEIRHPHYTHQARIPCLAQRSPGAVTLLLTTLPSDPPPPGMTDIYVTWEGPVVTAIPGVTS